jgi:hypothetical protein
MKKRTYVAALAIVLGSAVANAKTFTGVITDTMCGASHGMMKGQPDDRCVKMCAKASSEYALFDGKTVWKLSDQKAPAKFAAKRVTVTGTYDEKSKTIKVTAIAPEGQGDGK